MTLYLDMDGVVADFNGALLRAGVACIGHYIHKPKSEWTAAEAAHDKAVSAVMGDPLFWWEMPPFYGVEYFFDSVLRISPHKVKFLTALPRNPHLAEMVSAIKPAWLRRYLGVLPRDVVTCLRSEKQNYAKAGSILVDDLPANCAEWQAAGGIPILHDSYAETLFTLENLHV